MSETRQAETARDGREAELVIRVTEAQIEHLRQYAIFHGGAHEEDCPQDDTCTCKYKPLNDAIDAICAQAFDAVLREAADRLAAPVGEMPSIEPGDWVLTVSSDRVDRAIVIRETITDPSRLAASVIRRVVEIRKADGRVWRRTNG